MSPASGSNWFGFSSRQARCNSKSPGPGCRCLDIPPGFPYSLHAHVSAQKKRRRPRRGFVCAGPGAFRCLHDRDRRHDRRRHLRPDRHRRRRGGPGRPAGLRPQRLRHPADRPELRRAGLCLSQIRRRLFLHQKSLSRPGGIRLRTPTITSAKPPVNGCRKPFA